MESAEQYGLKARVEAPTTVHKGDTAALTVHVTWTSAPQAWLLLPQNSPEGQQLVQVGVSTDQVRTVHNGTETPEIQVKYQLLAKDTGTASIPAMQFQLPLVTGGSVQISSEPLTIRVVQPTVWGLWIAIVVTVVVAGVSAFVIWRKKRQKRDVLAIVDAEHQQLQTKFQTLASRVQVADPRAWILELEALCMEARTLARKQASDKPEQWKKLEDAFAQARYGGGPRDVWENKEWLRIARGVFEIHDSVDEDKHG